jgi:hypothetical protein
MGVRKVRGRALVAAAGRDDVLYERHHVGVDRYPRRPA